MKLSDKILADARAISCGTLATLIGRGDYATIEMVRGAFLEWLHANVEGQFTWQQAWLNFAKSGHLCGALGIPEPTVADLAAGWDTYIAARHASAEYARNCTDGFTKPLGSQHGDDFMRLHEASRAAHSSVHLLHKLRGDDSRVIEAVLEAAERRHRDNLRADTRQVTATAA